MKKLILTLVIISSFFTAGLSQPYFQQLLDQGSDGQDYVSNVEVSTFVPFGPGPKFKHFAYRDSSSIQYDALSSNKYTRLSYAVVGVDSNGRIFHTPINILPFTSKYTSITINGDTKTLESNRTWTLTTDNIPEGLSNFYFNSTRFNSSFAAKSTDNLTEGTRLYFTNERGRSVVSVTNTGTSGAATYDQSTGIFNIPNYATGATVSAPTSGISITSGAAFQPSTTGNSTINITTTLSGILGLVGDIQVEWATSSGGTYTTYNRESLGLLVAGIVYSSVSVTVPQNMWIKVTLTKSALATISATYTKVSL